MDTYAFLFHGICVDGARTAQVGPKNVLSQKPHDNDMLHYQTYPYFLLFIDDLDLHVLFHSGVCAPDCGVEGA